MLSFEEMNSEIELDDIKFNEFDNVIMNFIDSNLGIDIGDFEKEFKSFI